VKNIKILFYFLTLIILFSSEIHATVGGEQKITVLGIEKQEEKLFFLVDDFSGRGGLPYLYYILLKKEPMKAVFVKSYYPNGIDMQEDKDVEQFMSRLNKLKKYLSKLQVIQPEKIKFGIIADKGQKVPNIFDDNKTMIEHETLFKLSYNDGKKSYYGQSVVKHYDYRMTSEIKVQKAYRLANSKEIVVVVRYLGLPYETGYTMDNVVILK